MVFSIRTESRATRKWQAHLEGRTAQRRVANFHAPAMQGSLLRDQRQSKSRAGSYRTGSALKALEYVLAFDAGDTRPVVLD